MKPTTSQSNSDNDESGTLYRGRGRKRHRQVIHPYLGYVVDPTSSKDKVISEYGFLQAIPPISSKTDSDFIIGIFGGSFAAESTTSSVSMLIKELKQSRDFHHKRIIVRPFAMEGYKQPQQLLTLIYFLSLGEHFDIVINLDGFNEVALPAVENVSKKVFPFFPRNWFGRVHTFRDTETLLILSEILLLTERQRAWAALFVNTPLRYSITCNLLWEYYNNILSNLRFEKEIAFQQYKISEKENVSYLVTGPSFHYAKESEMYKDLAGMWKRSSIQMNNVCKANGIDYYHFLQPNQYVVNSKIMEKEELRIAYAEDHMYKKGVEKGYPYLIEEGKDLVNQGVKFYDLTMIFANNKELLYKDICCHLNEKGYNIIAITIGKVIREETQKN